MTPSNQFEQLIAEGKIEFHDATTDALTDWGYAIVGSFLTRHNIGWKLGNVKVGEAYCLKIDDPYLQYLDILEDTEQFMWCTDDHHDSVHPDDASAYLIHKSTPGVTVDCIRDEKTGLRRMILHIPDGRDIVIDDLRGP